MMDHGMDRTASISLETREKENMQMRNGLTACLTLVESYGETVGAQCSHKPFRYGLNRKEQRAYFFPRKACESRTMIPWYDDSMPWGLRMDV